MEVDFGAEVTAGELELGLALEEGTRELGAALRDGVLVRLGAEEDARLGDGLRLDELELLTTATAVSAAADARCSSWAPPTIQ